MREQSARFQFSDVVSTEEPRWCEILGLCDLGDSGVTGLLRAAEEDVHSLDAMNLQWKQDVTRERERVLRCSRCGVRFQHNNFRLKFALLFGKLKVHV